MSWETIPITPDFEWRIGDCIALQFHSISKAQADPTATIGARVTELKDNKIREVIVFEGPETLTYTAENGDKMCAPLEILNDGYLDVLTETGVRRCPTLIPKVGSDHIHFILPEKVVRQNKDE